MAAEPLYEGYTVLLLIL